MLFEVFLPYGAMLTKTNIVVPEVTHIHSFNPRGVEIEHIFALDEAVSEIRANFQNSHSWA